MATKPAPKTGKKAGAATAKPKKVYPTFDNLKTYAKNLRHR